MKPLHLDQPPCSILEAGPVWEVMASARAPQTPTATADGQPGHASPLAPASVPGCSHSPTLQPHRDSPGEMMTPPSYETQLWINWIPWENTVQYQLVTLQRGQHNELYLWSGASCAHCTQEHSSGAQRWSPRATAKPSPGTQQKEHSGSKASGPGWKGHNFPVPPLEMMQR